ncbi:MULTISPECIES: hypothetical protein [unclassified Paraburkholderia]|uniref:hypothetical protein n=1 Tax=unclassified Paraburkholderia TaxID=2615204 RepID=UPI0011B24BCF|nr:MULTISPECIES: hypothetical protein [unclassified Paraburkholderia]
MDFNDPLTHFLVGRRPFAFVPRRSALTSSLLQTTQQKHRRRESNDPYMALIAPSDGDRRLRELMSTVDPLSPTAQITPSRMMLSSQLAAAGGVGALGSATSMQARALMSQPGMDKARCAPAFDGAGNWRGFAATRIDVEHVRRRLFDVAATCGGRAPRIQLLPLIRHLCRKPSTVPPACASDSPSASSPDIF